MWRGQSSETTWDDFSMYRAVLVGYKRQEMAHVHPTGGPAEMSEPWVSVEDVARHLGVAKDSVYRWIEAKSLPAHRIGRLWKFKLSEVDEWVRARGADDAADRSQEEK